MYISKRARMKVPQQLIKNTFDAIVSVLMDRIDSEEGLKGNPKDQVIVRVPTQFDETYFSKMDIDNIKASGLRVDTLPMRITFTDSKEPAIHGTYVVKQDNLGVMEIEIPKLFLDFSQITPTVDTIYNIVNHELTHYIQDILEEVKGQELVFTPRKSISTDPKIPLEEDIPIHSDTEPPAYLNAIREELLNFLNKFPDDHRKIFENVIGLTNKIQLKNDHMRVTKPAQPIMTIYKERYPKRWEYIAKELAKTYSQWKQENNQ